jgi:transcriptional repressor NrdR
MSWSFQLLLVVPEEKRGKVCGKLHNSNFMLAIPRYMPYILTRRYMWGRRTSSPAVGERTCHGAREVHHLRCPKCSGNADRVIETREIADSSVIRRRRECELCGARYTTYERPAPQHVLVVKRDGRKEAFEREKLIRGIEKACANRPVDIETIVSVAQDIEDQLLVDAGSEISSAKLGEAVLGRLLEIDRVAYLRFASVYKRFCDPSDFSEELARLTELVGSDRTSS